MLADSFWGESSAPAVCNHPGLVVQILNEVAPLSFGGGDPVTDRPHLVLSELLLTVAALDFEDEPLVPVAAVRCPCEVAVTFNDQIGLSELRFRKTEKDSDLGK